MIELVPLIACLLIAVGIGSNDTSNALGICVGCGIIQLRRAILFFGVFVVIGILVQGQEVMKTVGKDLVQVTTPMLGVSLIVSAALIFVSNWKKLPLSTHQVIIGSLVGAGTASGSEINLLRLGEVVVSWLVSPVVAFFLAHALYRLMERTLSKLPLFSIEQLLRGLLLLSGSLIAYNIGANELATILGPVIHAGILKKLAASLIGSGFLIFGALFLSDRVIETVGKGITALDPYSGFAAQFGAGISVLFFTFLGMPVSTTYCIVGAISGVGLVKGMGTVRLDLVRKILLNWIVAPSLAFSFCYGLMTMMKP